LLEDDLPMVDEGVTVEHLLGHRSGIGDYLDEEVHQHVNDYVLTVPVNELTTTEAYVRVLDGYPSKFAPVRKSPSSGMSPQTQGANVPPRRPTGL
jgi:hypothetical protein